MARTYLITTKALLAVGASLCFGPVIEAKDRAVSTVTILVYNYADVPAHTLAGIETVAARLFRDANIEIAWWDCPADAPNPNRGPCPSASASAPALRIQPQFRPGSDKVHLDAIGFATGYVAIISFGRAQALARLGVGTVEDILGHVIAHEVGHILLAGHAHAAWGIMKARWNLDDWAKAQRGALFFTTGQGKLMRRELRMRRSDRVQSPDHISARVCGPELRAQRQVCPTSGPD